MTNSDGFLELLRDQLRAVGPVRVQRMFRSAGIYCDGVMFALVSDDTLYLKVDDGNSDDFEAEALPPFSYETKRGRTTIMSYRRAPERLLDDTDELLTWARAALAAANRAHRAKPKRGRAQPKLG